MPGLVNQPEDRSPRSRGCPAAPLALEKEAAGLGKSTYVAMAAFRRTLRRFLRFAEEGARASGLTHQQYQLLLAVRGNPNRDWAFVHELADALQIRHHAAVGLVNRCERAGFVRREQDPHDRRHVRVSLTESGATALGRIAYRNRNELRALRESLELVFPEETPHTQR
jgi:DNA-binding MarR family transcriptional regulator